MKELKITIILIVIVVIAETILIKGYYTNKVSNINTNVTNYTNTNKTLQHTVEPSINMDSLFYQNQNKINKLIYFIPESYNYLKTKSEINILQNDLLGLNSKYYIWILSAKRGNNSYVKK